MQLFVNQLTNVDFSYLDAQRGIVGETWLASALLEGVQDDEGMICDFGIVKKILRHWLDEELDHRLLVPTLSKHLEYRIQEDRIELTWHLNTTEAIHMEAPLQAVALVEAECITSLSTAEWCKQQLSPIFPTNVDHLHLTFSAESIDGAFYHYSHGLKKHAGNCQRIAHGHRSRIHIWLDDEPAPSLEQEWATRWQDIYLGLEEDITQRTETTIAFVYQANQGLFQLSLPTRCCYLLPMDTTVENLAVYLAQTIKESHSQHRVKVQAFEGINKGAIAIAR